MAIKNNKRYVWLDPQLYPDYQRERLCYAEFKKELYVIAPIDIEITANARYMLFVNNEYIGRGPTSVGGDFLDVKIREPYFEVYSVNQTGKVEIKVIVTSMPTAMTEFDFGHPGLWVNVRQLGKLVHEINESWDARLLSERTDAWSTDYTREAHSFSKAKFINKTFGINPSPIEHLVEEKIYPDITEDFVVKSGENRTLCLNFDKIYSAYPCLDIKAEGKCTVTVATSENGSSGKACEAVITDKSVSHFSPRMRSIGKMVITVENQGDKDVTLSNIHIDYIHYPVYQRASFKTSDSLINKIYDVCMHTLEICRQSIHLDSPTHQEPLACTGDYYIQSLIEYLSLGDPILAEWDIRRTSNLLILQDGRIFHTTYSLIYAEWVYEHYMHTGNIEVVNEKAIKLLLNRFDSYISKENGLIEYAPDYMFVDWVVASETEDKFLDGGKMMSHGKMEGFSLHHPPKALGQSVLCMFYYNALDKLSQLFSLLNKPKLAEECTKKAEKLKESINSHLFCKEKGLYIGGLNTPNMVAENQWLPKNTDTVYYLKQANVLAVLFGIAPQEKRKDILKYVVTDLNKFEMQPYFYHFLLSALYNEGMLGEYGMELIRRYKSLIDRCDKGLCEAWENMDCDCSHAWGAAPAYILKKAISGLEILEPGFKKIKLSPQLFDLDSAELQITTPYGLIDLKLQKGKEPIAIVPSEIAVL